MKNSKNDNKYIPNSILFILEITLKLLSFNDILYLNNLIFLLNKRTKKIKNIKRIDLKSTMIQYIIQMQNNYCSSIILANRIGCIQSPIYKIVVITKGKITFNSLKYTIFIFEINTQNQFNIIKVQKCTYHAT